MTVLSPLRVPLQGMLVALAGVGAAWLYLNGHWWIPAAALVILGLLGVGLNVWGKARLPGHPVAAVRLLQGWLLMPLAVAVLAAAAAIVLTIDLTTPEGTGTETKVLVGAVSTAVVAFLTVGFIAWTSDTDDSQLADHVKAAFEAKYDRPGGTKAKAHIFNAGSTGDLWVFGNEVEGIEGWGWKARRKRATGIAAELASGDSDP